MLSEWFVLQLQQAVIEDTAPATGWSASTLRIASATILKCTTFPNRWIGSGSADDEAPCAWSPRINFQPFSTHNQGRVCSTELVSIVRSRSMFAFSSDERAFNIESYFRTDRAEVKIEFTVRKVAYSFIDDFRTTRYWCGVIFSVFRTSRHLCGIIFSVFRTTRHRCGVIFSVFRTTRHRHDVIFSVFRTTQHRCGVIFSVFRTTRHCCGAIFSVFRITRHRCNVIFIVFRTTQHRCGLIFSVFRTTRHRCGDIFSVFRTTRHRCGVIFTLQLELSVLGWMDFSYHRAGLGRSNGCLSGRCAVDHRSYMSVAALRRGTSKKLREMDNI
ncbi:hypothetical protein ANN_01858 [Periplaneta americana]|uniref:Uncharacterized protein n=1 Tax=Periplaneta americana TaxID=6978 RepID=A0ABQ8TUQ7_PERAM|nr:hypothetical protein ANN_01858 [Periplaneta americana]